MEENKKNKYAPQNKYIKGNTIQYAFRLNKNTDTELIEFFSSVENKSGLIKELLKEYLKKNKNI
ncbi:MAG: hypothetical protein IJZ29_05295 [Clostridia bacterium]|nr:hypothetical protein [Clostridia bacterium]